MIKTVTVFPYNFVICLVIHFQGKFKIKASNKFYIFSNDELNKLSVIMNKCVCIYRHSSILPFEEFSFFCFIVQVFIIGSKNPYSYLVWSYITYIGTFLCFYFYFNLECIFSLC